MQKGLATLEIILVVFIISLLVGAAIPNAARILDTVALDYETKKIYTDLRFLQSFDRMTQMKDTHFINEKNESFELVVYPERFTVERTADSKVFAEHYFSKGVTASKNSDGEYWKIKFDDAGRVTPAESDSLELNSRFGKTYIVFDSVGRFRGGRTDEQAE